MSARSSRDGSPQPSLDDHSKAHCPLSRDDLEHNESLPSDSGSDDGSYHVDERNRTASLTSTTSPTQVDDFLDHSTVSDVVHTVGDATGCTWEYTIDSASLVDLHPESTLSPTGIGLDGKAALNRRRFLSSRNFAIQPQQHRQQAHLHQHPRSQSWKKRLVDLTINKLQFEKVDMYGREKERQELQDIWEEVHQAWLNNNAMRRGTDPNSPPARQKHVSARRFVSISGASGTGKSSLAETLRVPVQRSGGFFLPGKFPHQHELSHRLVVPYAAFAGACSELCEMVVSLFAPTDSSSEDLSHNSQSTKSLRFTLSEFRARLNSELGADASILTHIMPVLLQILKVDGDASEEEIGHLDAHCRFKFAFRRFWRTVATFGPIVLVLDDLQWADSSSMELLEALVADRDNSSIMAVCCFRDDPLFAKLPHMQTLDNIHGMVATSNVDNGLKTYSIPIGNLNPAHIRSLLTDLMSLSESDALALAECVHKKTHGNIFFVIQFVKSLQESDLLSYNITTLKWTLDAKAIQTSTAATDNVVSLMKKKMENLPNSIKQFLPIMACLGSTFSVLVFELLFSQIASFLDKPFDEWRCDSHSEGADCKGSRGSREDPHEKSRRALQCLTMCAEEGLMETCEVDGETSFYWAHDKIQEAAFSLINETQLQRLKFECGQILSKGLSSAELEKHLLLVVNLMDSDCMAALACHESRRLEMASLYLRAGVKAIENAAFEQAAGYLSTGIALLPSNHWQEHYELSLELYSTAAEAEFRIGNFERMSLHCNAVLSQHGRPLLDKRRVYVVLVDGTAAEEGMAAAYAYCRSILANLGCKFPTLGVSMHVLAGLIRVKSTLRKLSEEPNKALDLPQLSDDLTLWMMTLLDKFTTFTYITKPELLPLVVFRGLRMTLHCGISAYSSPVFAFIGLLLAAFVRDYKGGHLFGAQAIELLKRVRSSRNVESRVLFVVHAFVLHWQRPITMSIKPLLGSYEVGMAMGDNASALMSIYFYLEYSFRTGCPMGVLIEDCAYYAVVMREVKQLQIVPILQNLWQTMLFLTGENRFTGTLDGDVVDQEEELRQVSGDDRRYLFAAIYRMQMYVAFVFGRHDLVYQSLLKTKMHKGAYEKIFPGLMGLCHLYAFNGLSMFSMYRKSRLRKYLRLARKFASKINHWSKAGNPNVPHYDALLGAELQSLRGHVSAAASGYESAILYAGRCGLIPDRALAHERYAEHLDRLGPSHIQDTDFHFREALKLYGEWGAHAKVEQIKRTHLSLMGPSVEIQLDMTIGL